MKQFSGQFVKEKIIQSIRQFLIDRQFHEVDTPLLLPSLPLEPGLFSFKTHWPPHHLDLYLTASPESSLKKLIAQGIGNCFAITKSFRNLEDVGPTHNLEFTLLEWYEMDHDHHQLAQTVEELFNFISPSTVINYQGQKIDLTPPWPRFSLSQLFLKYANFDLSQNLTLPSLKKTALNKGYNVTAKNTWEELFDQILLNEIEPHLDPSRPTFIFDYPTQLSPLCQPCPEPVEGFSQRFELYLAGMEIANAYHELTSGKILKSNFQKEQTFRQKNKLPSHPYDQQLIQASDHLPPCAGIAIGLERLAMIFADTASINDVLYFPIIKFLSNKR